ncbi:hypothetical protein TeGR_g12665 [Tetraparma gracilis]|uniref:Pseudouridine synthase RsuA/RluA-like domain-containing protein n=1 Tax=Tetraparma gracilis TaxID=2962635 RepID=A0ABQ6N821_9STRA|nr:hypothetical protein TeGR_g12665 [Tetraparma gracilis]
MAEAFLLADAKPRTHVRLSKRLSELAVCSRREADEILKGGGKVRVFVRGEDVTAGGVGQKVEAEEEDIRIGLAKASGNSAASFTDWNARRHETIVLNKPIGYVSGTPQITTQRGSWTEKITFDTGRTGHAYKPAIQLVHNESYYEPRRGGVGERPSENLIKKMLMKHKGKGLAPAGRLDINSSGLLVFTRDGVVARMLVSENSDIEKEYLVRIAPKDGVVRQC